jgi:lipopolysaccharide export system protein LptA
MKMLYLIALTALAAGTTARAQMGTNTAPHFLRLLDIHADIAEGILGGHTFTNRGHVHVSSPGFDMTCEQLVASSPQSGGRVNHIVAETNVVIDATDAKGQTVHATGEKAVYDYSVENGVTNEPVTLTGNPQPQVVIPDGTNTADVIVWNRANNSFHFYGNWHLSPNLNREPAGTNAPAAATNELTATKMSLPPGADTNFPPGSLDLVPPRGGRGGPGF